MPRMGKIEEDWNGLKLGFLKMLKPRPSDGSNATQRQVQGTRIFMGVTKTKTLDDRSDLFRLQFDFIISTDSILGGLSFRNLEN